MRIFTVNMAPVNPPHNDGVKNILVSISEKIKRHDFIFVSSAYAGAFPLRSNVRYIRSIFEKPGRHSMSVGQIMFVLIAMMFNLPGTDILQFFITPKRGYTVFLRAITKLSNKKSIQVVPSVHTLFANNDKVSDDIFFADRVIVQSDYAMSKLCALGVKNVSRIYPGINTEEYKYRPDCRRAANRRRVIYAGTYKLIDTAYSLEAFLEIVRGVCVKDPSVEFVMACRLRTKKDIELKETFKRMVLKSDLADRFLYLDRVVDMPVVMNTCDIGIMPCKRVMPGVLEIPMALIEGAASGLAVIYGDVPPLMELEKKGIGVMLSSSLPSDYSQKIIELLNDACKIEEIREKSGKAVVEYFDVNKMAEEYGRVYDSLRE
ncbi:MAG TPA: glycosyltransferase family 4 protein [Candidatus Omnitrophota bacterium]|nr:glycosyltransferase family 4 protein [Candidatus Omnitrophota bacterium]HPS19543.1 glycosyltransferase family 4 protein [Candidatus Omnitrophota bacterium]